MKKLTREQKNRIHGGGAVVGIVHGVSAILTSLSMAASIAADYLMDRGSQNTSYERKPYEVQEPKTFTNSIESKITILS